MVKTCFKCGVSKPIEMFYVHKQMADGHLGKCKTCTKKDVNQRYYTPSARRKILKYEQARNKTPERQAQKKEYQKRQRARFPGKYRAHSAVCNAIRDGRLIRKPCEVCGSKKSEAHHEDYRRILDVKWLCFKHHREAHGQIVGSEIPFSTPATS